MTSTAYADPIHLSTLQADQSILCRSSALLRALRLFQHQAESRGVADGRGTCWRSVEWLASKLGVCRSNIYRIFDRLRKARWIADAFVVDEHGHERPGFAVAMGAEFGFATNTGPTLDKDWTLARHSLDTPPSIEFNEILIQSKSVTGRKPTQPSLLGASFDEPKIEASKRKDGKKRRGPRLREHAARVDEYERKRYQEHPRCTRPKRDTPEARKNSVEAITKAMERYVESFESDDLDHIELMMRAVVELNFDSAVRKIESWDWWSGSAMWTPSSLDRVLEWLSEPRNWIYIERAKGAAECPAVGTAQEISAIVDVTGLSPQEQQEDYNRRHGITAQVKNLRDYEASFAVDLKAGKIGPGLSDYLAGETVFMPDPEPPVFDAIQRTRNCNHSTPTGLGVMVDLPTDNEQKAAGAMIDACGVGDGSLDEVMAKLIGGVADAAGVPAWMLGGKPKNDDELRRESERKLAYVRATTPEVRAEDSKAGRKPWEVK